MPIIIPDLFTPYLNGVRLARQDNWNDLQQYNQVQQQQLRNAEAMATFSPRVNREYEATDRAALENMFSEYTLPSRVAANLYQTRRAARTDNLEEAALPGVYAQQAALSQGRVNMAPAYGQSRSQAEVAAYDNARAQAGYNVSRLNMPVDPLGRPMTTTPGTSSAMPIPGMPNPAGTQAQQQGTTPVRQQTSQTPRRPTSLPAQPTTADAVNTGIYTPSMQAQATLDAQRSTQLADARSALAARGITPGTRSSFEFPGLTGQYGGLVEGMRYDLVPSTQTYNNADILKGLLELSSYSYDDGSNTDRYRVVRSLTDDPLQDVVDYPIQNLIDQGLNADTLYGMSNGSYLVGPNNTIIVRDRNGNMFAVPVNVHTGTASMRVPFMLPDRKDQ